MHDCMIVSYIIIKTAPYNTKSVLSNSLFDYDLCPCPLVFKNSQNNHILFDPILIINGTYLKEFYETKI